MRVFTIGNSFASNATQFLPDLAQESGLSLELGGAKIGGCSLQKHWELHLAGEKPYSGQSLSERLAEGSWDIVTLQQASIDSSDLGSYQPYARYLWELVRQMQPWAEIAWHQTWAYHTDSPKYGRIAIDQNAESALKMWEKSRAAYHAMAGETQARIIPVGDAFWAANSDLQWSSSKDLNFNFDNPHHPELPAQPFSLHRAYHWFWSVDGCWKIGFDGAHASEAGCYLGALVWYGFLFGQSAEKLKFAPSNIAADFAAYLRCLAWETVTKSKSTRL